MSRRRRKKDDRMEALVMGPLVLLMLVALGIGGVKHFVPALINLVVGLAGLGLMVGGLWWGWRYFNRLGQSEVDAVDDLVGPDAEIPPGSVPLGWTLDRIENALAEIDWFQFEKFCAALLRAEGYAVERKGGAQPDGGVDLVATKDGQATLVQCKQWRTRVVQENVIRELLGSMTHFKVQRGALYALKGATRPALAFAAEHGLAVVDGAALAARANGVLDEATLSEVLNSREHHCPRCESLMVWRTGNFEPFWGCSRYPRCHGKFQGSGAE